MSYILNVKFNFFYLLFQILNSNFIILYIKRYLSISNLKGREHLDFR